MIRLPILLILSGFMPWVAAQELVSNSSTGRDLLVNPLDLPDLVKAQGLVADDTTEIVNQDAETLDPKAPEQNLDEPIPELVSLHHKTVYDVVSRTAVLPVSAVNGERIGNDLRTVSAIYRKAGQQEAECLAPALSVTQRVKANPKRVLEIVDEELRANAACACEIVKAAILATDMRVETVVAIVRVAIEANPETMRLVAQCAIAACPEALSAIQELLAEYEKKSGYGDSAKSAKSAKGEEGAILPDEVAAIPNPLDFPGGPQGYNLIIFDPPIIIVTPPTVTVVDP